MTYDSLFIRQELFVASATVGAYANSVEGFRQRDVKFLFDLFVNWVESALQRNTVQLKNTQVMRYLNFLCDEGFARRLTRGAHAHYKLTRTGLLELLSRMVEKPQLASGTHFFFLYFFIKNYGPRIQELVKNEGKLFPYALKIEIERLLDTKALVSRELSFAKKELSKLEHRVNDAQRTSDLVRHSTKQGRKFEDVVQEAEKLYPYELNSQKPLTELIFSIPESARQWELEVGNLKRIEDLWVHEIALLKTYIAQIEKAGKAD